MIAGNYGTRYRGGLERELDLLFLRPARRANAAERHRDSTLTNSAIGRRLDAECLTYR